MQKAAVRPMAQSRTGAMRSLRAVMAVVFAMLVAGLAVVLNKLDLTAVDTLDKHVGDWRIALGSPRAAAQRRDIAIVIITEETLLDYESRSPIDRALLAELIRAIDLARPKAIGLDFIFDRRTRHDARLLAALREAKAPVVLGNIDERVTSIAPESLAIQADFLKTAGRPRGHLMLARKEGRLAGNDSVIRSIAAPYAAPAGAGAADSTVGGTRGMADVPATGSPAAFVDVLAAAAGVTPKPDVRLIAWQRQPDERTPLFLTLSVPRHSEDAVKPALEGLFLPSWREFLKDRIVLIGAAMIDRDQHTTPLSVIDPSGIPGILIHAQALAQRIDGNRDIGTLPDWIVSLVAGFVALSCFVAARRTGVKPNSFAYGFIGLVLIGATSFVAFSIYRIDFPSVALTIAWALGGFGGFVSRWIVPSSGPDG